VKGTDANGCSNTDTVTVNITMLNKGGYLMPTAFTPNNDGVNDCYGIHLWGVINELEFSIFNRWVKKYSLQKILLIAGTEFIKGNCKNQMCMFSSSKQKQAVVKYLKKELLF